MMVKSGIRFAFVMVALLGLLSVADCSTEDQNQELFEWLCVHPGYGTCTIVRWRAMDSSQKTCYVLGLLKGRVAGNIIVNHDFYPIEKQKQKLYLLNGWSMTPSAYISEVDVILSLSKAKIKSISEAMVLAESKFASNAGQETRSVRLKYEALDVYMERLEDDQDSTSVMNKGSDGQKWWHTMVGANCAGTFVEGFIDGIELTRATVVSEIDPSTPWRVGQSVDEIDKQAPQWADDDSVLGIYLYANATMCAAARGE